MKFVENNENKSICSKCKGRCYQRYAGIFHPDDFEQVTYESIESVLLKGEASIDWYEELHHDDKHYPRGYFVRMRHKGGDIVDPSWGAECIHWSMETGCNILFDNRPYGCKVLAPIEYDKGDYSCGYNDDVYNKRTAAIDWIPYYDILDKLYKMYNKDTFTGEKVCSFEQAILNMLGIEEDTESYHVECDTHTDIPECECDFDL